MFRYRGGSRGFATSTRAGRYTGVPMWRHIAEFRRQHASFVAQIEDPVALDEIDAIAAIDGVDSLFIGRGDLTAAFGDESKEPPAVRKAVERISEAARKAGKSISVYVGNGTEAAWLNSLGANVFVLSSDQGFLRQAAPLDCATCATRSGERSHDSNSRSRRALESIRNQPGRMKMKSHKALILATAARAHARPFSLGAGHHQDRLVARA